MKKNFVTKAIALSLVMVLMALTLSACGGGGKNPSNPSGTGDGGQADAGVPGEIAKPDKITAMMTTIITKENGYQEVEKEYEAFTGIKLEIIKPEHTQFYEKVNLAFASGDVPNIIELGSTYYPNYATYGALWDMTDAWNNSTEPAKSIVDERFVEVLKINGRLYGFPMQRGNGTITYVRQDWMDELGLSAPANYAEFLDMLRAFKAKDSKIIPISAAGLYNNETPYDIYLREFYQDARPDFILVDGQFVDGMLQPEMKDALQRMRDAYAEGLIDTEIVTNKTSTVRDKFYGGLLAVFNYWAGYWNRTLEEQLIAADPNGKVMPIPAIAETKYVERPPTAMVITNASQNPEGIFKYFVQYSHDGGQGQMLFSHGKEGFHWETKADGTVASLPYQDAPQRLVEKAFYSPELSITSFDDPIEDDPRVTYSLSMFNDNSEMDGVPRTSDVIAAALPELNTVKSEIISKIVFGEYTVDEGLEIYQNREGASISMILAELNSQL